MQRIVRILLIVFILWLAVSGTALAQDFPKAEGLVNDFAGLISEGGSLALGERLLRLEEDTSDVLVVVTIATLDTYSIEDYAVRLFEEWGIGQKDLDNGVLFIVAVKERDVRIEVGYGLEEIITDGRAGRILDDEVIPYFKDGDYESGILAGVLAIEGYLRDGTPPSIAEENPLQDMGARLDYLIPILFVVGWLSIYVFSFMARTKSIWLGGVWGIIVGLVLGFTVGGLLIVILLPIGLAGLGTFLDFLLSKNYKARVSSRKSTGWISSRGGFSSGSRSSSSSRSSSFGGGGLGEAEPVEAGSMSISRFNSCSRTIVNSVAG